MLNTKGGVHFPIVSHVNQWKGKLLKMYSNVLDLQAMLIVESSWVCYYLLNCRERYKNVVELSSTK